MGLFFQVNMLQDEKNNNTQLSINLDDYRLKYYDEQ